MIKLVPEDYATLASSTKELAEALAKTEEYKKLVNPYRYPTECLTNVCITVTIASGSDRSLWPTLTLPVEEAEE